MVFICLKIFAARILDVSISTFRTMIMIRGKKILSVCLAFVEVFIWFYAARTALTTEVTSIFIPVSYALGYASGSFIGLTLSEKFIRGKMGVQVITKKDVKKLVDLIKQDDFGVSEIKLTGHNKAMLYIQINSARLDELKKIIIDYDNKAFIIVNETKFVSNGWIK